jgi:hypothetical protein
MSILPFRKIVKTNLRKIPRGAGGVPDVLQRELGEGPWRSRPASRPPPSDLFDWS